MIAADQREDWAWHVGFDDRQMSSQCASESSGAAPQYASWQRSTLGHDGVEVGVGFGVARAEIEALCAQCCLQIDAGVAPSVLRADQLAATARDAALEREGRR